MKTPSILAGLVSTAAVLPFASGQSLVYLAIVLRIKVY